MFRQAQPYQGIGGREAAQQGQEGGPEGDHQAVDHLTQDVVVDQLPVVGQGRRIGKQVDGRRYILDGWLQ